MKREVKIGIFAIVILLCTWAGIRFLSGVDVFSRNRVYHVYYDQVNGVQTATPVVIRGVKVGKVSEILLNQSGEGSVELSLSISRKYDIPTDSKAKIFSNGFLGNKAIEIELGSATTYLSSGDRIDAGYDRNLMDMAGSEYEFLKQKVTDLISNLSLTLDNVNGLIDANERNIHGVITHLDSMTGSMDEVLTSNKQVLAAIIANLSAFSEALERNTERLDSIMLNVNTVTADLAQADVASNLQSVINKLNTTLDKINEGEGSVARLMNDPALYDNLTSASANLSSLLADLEAYPKRYVHFSLFGRGPKADERDRRKAAKAAAAVAEEPATDAVTE